jgi:hypothetical protein
MLKFFDKNADRNYKMPRSSNSVLCLNCKRLKQQERVPFVLKFIKKLKSALPRLFTFILNPKVEPTNNRAERGLREHLVIRKIIGTLQNEKGTRIYETITSVLATWRQNGLNINDMLRYKLS